MRRFIGLAIGLKFCIIILLFSSCIDKIQLDVPDGLSTSIVIQGKLTKSDVTSIKVKIDQLFNFDGLSEFFSVDKVILIDETDNKIEIPWIGDNTYYKILDDVFLVEYGRSYKLRVQLKDESVIESDFSQLKQLEKNNSLRYEIISREEFNEFGQPINTKYIQYYYKIKISDDIEINYRHDITRTYRFTDYREPRNLNGILQVVPMPSDKRRTCYITDNRDILNMKLIDQELFSKIADQDQFYESMIYEELIDWVYAEDYMLTVIQESLDQEAMIHFDKISNVLDFTGGMFEAIPSQVNSNMRYINDSDEDVFGYFYASDLDTTRIFIPKQEVERPDTICLIPIEGISSGSVLVPEQTCYWITYACCDCLTWENSTLIQPSFWIE